MKKLVGFLLKFWVLFILVEVIWMLLPFAGFLYGSVFHMEYLNRNLHTAWLTHFVFPVHTLFPLGIILMSVGFLVFLLGAAQIYTAKFRKTGLVTAGLYKKIRHPQYIALILFGLGTLLTWGRFITFIAFFVMMFLYYYLAHSEERNCQRQFGETYEEYKARTYFLFPGEGWIRNIWLRLPRVGLPRWVSVPIRLTLAVGLALILGFLIQSVKVRYQEVPFITAEIESLPQALTESYIPYMESEGGRLIMVQGPLWLAQNMSYAKRLIEIIGNSPTLQKKLHFLKDPVEDRAIILVGPSNRPSKTVPSWDAPVDLFIVRTQPTESKVEVLDLLTNPSKRKFVSAFVATIDPDVPDGQNPVLDWEEQPDVRITPRWMNIMERIRERVKSLADGPGKGPRKLILVQAPLVRARDAGFAQEIMSRLLRSATVKQMLAMYQIGGDVVAIAFPRPGPNWYREHHGVPQIGAFVMLARKKKPISDVELFHHDMKNMRTLEAAFIVEMDFAIPQPKDPVYQDPFIVGPLRNLEERWDFFLSGVK